MSNATIGLRLGKEAVEALDALCAATGKTRTLVVEELLLASDTDSKMSGFPVGAKLPLDFELKPHFTQKTALQTWLVFVVEQVVAIKCRSSNGTKKWLEVVAQYSDEAWTTAMYQKNWSKYPATLLQKATKDIKMKELMRQEEPVPEVSIPAALPEIPITSALEPSQLSRDDFIKRFVLLPNDYARVVNTGRDGWKAKDGTRWSMSGKGKNAIWTSETTPSE